ncbi:hypothetical protein FOPG_03478 [Fusarium oxysporum f. sp. conglutinans race 2 54008]|uniref:Uncharacterized protein n=1 Tax=Fusarium oxysporum f. sp. conglutinans race 2 54008 TaxID=1089457 RepID=X0JFV5_FUSOX|nr:hypothetical protein FOPG_03478 [Fusarium oxysporum f. sp. conglutinans race 2 54008]
MLYAFQRCRHARTQELGSSPRGLQTGTGSILRRLGQNHLDAARPPNMVESTVLIVSERGAMHVFKNNPYIIADAILDSVYQVASSPKHRLGNKVLSGIYERKESQF